MSARQSDYPVVIDGKTYLLRFKFKALELIESLAAKGELNGNTVAVKNVFFAGLRKHHAAITLEQCADILDDADDMTKTIADIMQAFRSATGQDSKKNEAQPEPTVNPEPEQA